MHPLADIALALPGVCLLLRTAEAGFTTVSIAESSKRLFLTAGIYAALCAPAILVAERLSWPERVFHVTQWLAVAVCLPAGLTFLWSTRCSPSSTLRWLALAATVLSGLWLSFLLYVLLTFDLSNMG